MAFTHPPIPDGARSSSRKCCPIPTSLWWGAATRLPPDPARRAWSRSARFDSRGVPGVCRAHATVERFLRSRGIEPRFVFRAEDNHLLLGLAAQGVGAAIMPALAIERSRDDVVLVDLEDEIPRRRIGLVRHPDRYQTPAATAYMQLARQTAADLADRILA